MTRIDINDQEAVAALARSCGVTIDQLHSAIRKVGTLEFDVRTQLQTELLLKLRSAPHTDPAES